MRIGRHSLAAALIATAVTLAALLVPPAVAAGTTSAFSGNCTFSGPISPDPPITVVPKPGAHFSYAGAGTCSGTLDGTVVKAAADTVTFTHVATVFDTCEFGPDFDLPGLMTVGVAPHRAKFEITINLARLALVGPFELTTTGDGRASGTATFTPPSTAGALQQCAAGGVGLATLAGTFKTSSPLIGVPDPLAKSAAPKNCVSGAHLEIALDPARGQRIVSAVVYLDGRLLKRVSGRDLSSVKLPKLSAGAHAVKVVTRSSRGRIRTIRRRYEICG